MKTFLLAFEIAFFFACGSYEVEREKMQARAEASSSLGGDSRPKQDKLPAPKPSAEAAEMSEGDLAMLRAWKKGEYQGNELLQIQYLARVSYP